MDFLHHLTCNPALGTYQRMGTGFLWSVVEMQPTNNMAVLVEMWKPKPEQRSQNVSGNAQALDKKFLADGFGILRIKLFSEPYPSNSHPCPTKLFGCYWKES